PPPTPRATPSPPFQVQPPPPERMANAPSASHRNRSQRPRTPARATPQAHGQYSSQLPIGRSSRISDAKGLKAGGSAPIKPRRSLSGTVWGGGARRAVRSRRASEPVQLAKAIRESVDGPWAADVARGSRLAAAGWRRALPRLRG